MSKASFRNLAGSEVYYGQDASQATTDGHVFGNAEYLILNNGTVYANAETNTDFTLDKTGIGLLSGTSPQVALRWLLGKGRRSLLIAVVRKQPLNIAPQKPLAAGFTIRCDWSLRMAVCLCTFLRYLDSKGCKSVEQLQKAAENPENYKTQLGMSLYDCEKNLYKFLGMQGVPVCEHECFKTFRT